MPLKTNIEVKVNATLTKALDLATTESPLAFKKVIELLTGTGAGQADKVFHDRRTLAAAAAEDLDLAGVLIDPVGDVLTFARIKGIFIVADAANPNNIVVGNAATNAFIGPFGAATNTHSVRPGGFYAWGCSESTGYVVTATTADLLHILAGAGGNHTYDVVIIGASA